jgi:hypothetical protein
LPDPPPVKPAASLYVYRASEPVPKLIDYALKRMVRTSGSMGQALAVFQAFSLRTKGSTKLRNLRLLSQKLKFWESLLFQNPVGFERDSTFFKMSL